MGQVTVTINGRPYPVACKSGEEERIALLAREIDDKVRDFARDVGPIGEARLLLLAALVLADELAEIREAAGVARIGNGLLPEAGKLAAGIEKLAGRIEAIAAKLETPHI